MPTFRRAPMEGSEELFRPTTPELVQEEISAAEQAPGRRYYHLYLTPDELQLLVDAVQLARYPDKPRTVQPLATFDRLAELRAKLEEARDQ